MVDPGAWELHLIEPAGVGMMAPVVEEGVRFSFREDGGDEVQAAAQGWERMHWVFTYRDGGTEGQQEGLGKQQRFP